MPPPPQAPDGQNSRIGFLAQEICSRWCSSRGEVLPCLKASDPRPQAKSFELHGQPHGTSKPRCPSLTLPPLAAAPLPEAGARQIGHGQHVAQQGLDSKRTGASYPRPEGRGFTARGDKADQPAGPIVRNCRPNGKIGYAFTTPVFGCCGGLSATDAVARQFLLT